MSVPLYEADVDAWRTMLADATYHAEHGQQDQALSLLNEAARIYSMNPAPYAAYQDELANAANYVSGKVDRLAVARANAEPESLGIVGEILTNDTIGDGISLVAGTMENAGLLDPNEKQSGQDIEGQKRAPKVLSLKLVGGVAVALLLLVVAVKVL